MWKAIEKHFRAFPAQAKVAALFLQTGLSVRKGKVYCNEIEVPALRIAKACKVDRRAVNATVKTISKEQELNAIYCNLKATAFFSEVAPSLKAGVIEIIPRNAAMPGIVADVTRIIAEMKISIRQCIAEEPAFVEKPKLFVITEKPVPPYALEELKKAKGVKSITVH